MLWLLLTCTFWLLGVWGLWYFVCHCKRWVGPNMLYGTVVTTKYLTHPNSAVYSWTQQRSFTSQCVPCVLRSLIPLCFPVLLLPGLLFAAVYGRWSHASTLSSQGCLHEASRDSLFHWLDPPLGFCSSFSFLSHCSVCDSSPLADP